MKLMAIDPGLAGMGVAIWNDPTDIVPVKAIVLNASRGQQWTDRVNLLAQEVLHLVKLYGVNEIVCEMMESYNTAMSQMAWGKGDLQKTMFLIGTINGVTRLRVKKFRLTPPREWKGQLPKSVTIQRVQAALGKAECRQLDIKTHAWDAVGIGLWHMGVIK